MTNTPARTTASAHGTPGTPEAPEAHATHATHGASEAHRATQKHQTPHTHQKHQTPHAHGSTSAHSATGTPVPRVLSIAGTDPTGGAGIQADLKTIGALGGYGMAVVTALVAQNTRGVRAVHVPDVDFLTTQLDAVSDDVTIDAVKLGMLHSSPLIRAVSAWIERVRPPIVVLDPVMVATSGDRLLDAAAVAALRELCGHADLITPNLPELGILADAPAATTWRDARAQAAALAAETGATILLKGGHLDGSACPDAIITAAAAFEVDGERIQTTNTHGTGCSLSAAMATLAAHGRPWDVALVRSKAWLAGAIRGGAALQVGGGNGPVDHFHELRGRVDTGVSWTAQRWAANAEVQAEIEQCAFVRGLADGTLPLDAFHRYLMQDALYLRDYARVLAQASALAPLSEEQDFWAGGSQGAVAEEVRLHRARVGYTVAEPRDVTTAYLDHLLATAARADYGVIVAAVLPCFWVYTEVGAAIGRDVPEDHPYRDWLLTYADPEFRIATQRAIEIADRAARDASPQQRHHMSRAFDAAMRHELAFFCDPLLSAPVD